MCTQKFPDPDQREEQISQVTNQEFKSLIERCVQPNPRRRPDMQEISSELETLFDSQSEREGDIPSIGEIEQMGPRRRPDVLEISSEIEASFDSQSVRKGDIPSIGKIEQMFRMAAATGNKDKDQSREIHQEANEPHTTSSIHPSREIPDWIIPRDQIELTDEWLGKGSWGRVFEGKYNGCAVAVKQIHDTLLSPDSQSLYAQKIDVASRCRHPCLLQFIGATNDEGFPLIVTELMETSLESLLTSKSLSEKEISFISKDVAGALSYLHHKLPSPIVHRDVSSANVLLWRQGHEWRGKLTISIATTFQRETMTTAPGDMKYSAPETITSTQTVKVGDDL